MVVARNSPVEECSVHYWEGQPHDEKGMMGGFEYLSPRDEANSRRMIEAYLLRGRKYFEYVAELGAGIGRVTTRVLLPYSEHIDVFEPVAANREVALKTLPHDRCTFYPDTLQQWTPRRESYDLIWIQFSLIYTSDDECLALLKRAQRAVQGRRGYVVIKDNMPLGNAKPVQDSTDGSVVRSTDHLLRLSTAAGLKLIRNHRQDHWPIALYPVSALILQSS
ncbi:methyltransferase domain protein [Gregarina niphandrodes]|uniref:Alpha N-terminal protein methyltransferase 1 n=1 Tax=Gregarina niphandrodes TaxID=110365 RepID=A0A023BBI0_GRENI|nr:methyltransferase domain protein [Gregarina niphandrodes]EZG79805.1 methyltransferase domain protein [Gregarina niphandrodes]|eukprot:XP_011134379.1 methyltransferase domain protein [Gregarina niphandrodes]